VNSDTDEEISTMRGPIPFPNPRAVLEFNFEMFGLTFPVPGEYLMQFLCDKEIVIQRKLTLTKIEEESAEESAEEETEEEEEQ
jgi:hypothetical protein